AVYPSDLPALRDSILVFIKTSKVHHLWAARRRGNRTVLDVQDTVVFKRRIKNRWLFDGLIFKNRRQLEDFGSPKNLGRVIYHQWDPRYTLNRVADGPFRAAYLGLERSFPLGGKIPGVDFYCDDYFVRALDYNCHLSYRPPGRDFLYKPNCKVSTAAGCDANLVTTRDESTIEFLGEDYPFYIDEEEAIAPGIERARALFGGPEWREGLERMREIRERTRIDRIIDDYLAFFD